MNCTSTWITISALISASSVNRHATADASPRKATEKPGKLPVEVRRPKGRKKRPSTAAAAGTRGTPSRIAKTEASEVQSTSTVTTAAARAPYSLWMKSETIDVEWMASRQGTTPRIVMFMVRYKAPTTTTAQRMERGTTFSGSRTSPAKKHTLLYPP